ncbi:glycogen synthase [Clostridium sp.]|uniref:glycogen synthase n=1 Tax=Clostridium sp. TaxID=1506 RepID=UPI00262C7A77|nr:glycogen/starch synthase [Clostridium sp.]
MNNSVLVVAGQMNFFNMNALNYGLIKKIRETRIDIRVLIPMSKLVKEVCLQELTTLTELKVNMYNKEITGQVKSFQYEGIDIYILDAPEYFDREEIYNQPYTAEIFSYFCRAALEVLPLIEFKPDIIHCEDWPTAFIPFILKEKYKDRDFYEGMKTIYTFNNIGYQGIFDMYNCSYLGFEWDKLLYSGLDYYEQINFMKAGLLYADRITTVSSNYIKEISSEMYGVTLDGIIRERINNIYGILNGIDLDINDPETDTNLYVNYNIDTPEGKKENKKMVQKQLGFAIDENIPIIFYNSSLTCEKGVDLIQYFLPDIMKENVQMIIMSSKEKGCDYEEELYEEFFKKAAKEYKGRFCYISFNEELVHKCFAGADMYLMPSAVEPCGFGQLIAMRYGTVPIVKEIGGLAETVQFFDKEPNEATGFCFKYSNEKVLLYTVRKAIEVYKNKMFWNNMVKNCMAEDFGVDKYVIEYIKLYKELIYENYSIIKDIC